MPGVDERLAQLTGGAGLARLVVAVPLGLRHATDPRPSDAVSTLAVSSGRLALWRAAALGASWGPGHATTLVGVGLPVVVFDR